jgi:hypothetical protein
MTRWERLAVAILAVCGMILLAPAVSAQAHDPNMFYRTQHWAPYSNVSFGYQTGFPTGEARFRVTEGKAPWTDGFSGPEPNFSAILADQNFGNPRLSDTPTSINALGGACYVTNNSIHWSNLDYVGSGVIGFTRMCVTAGRVSRFTIEIDSVLPTGFSWYTGTGTPGGTQVDLLSLATHEFGHATGWLGHFVNGDDVMCPADDSPTPQTMCPVLDPGETFWRTLGVDDSHTFDAAYPVPPTPPATDPCDWTDFGNASTCDGLGRNEMQNLGCTETAVDTRNLGSVAQISLMYSSKCRTVSARMKLNGVPPAGFNCYVKLERFSGSPHDIFRSTGVVNDWGYTHALDDAGVTSSAWGYCQWGSGATPITAATIAY